MEAWLWCGLFSYLWLVARHGTWGERKELWMGLGLIIYLRQLQLLRPTRDNLLAKLDTQEIFLAGETPNGEVYLAGSDYGVYGRLSDVEDGMIYIYSGFCDVGFG